MQIVIKLLAVFYIESQLIAIHDRLIHFDR